MEEKNNYDEIDLMLFDYFKNNNEIPNSTQNMVNNIFKETKSKPKHNFYNQIKKVAILIISLGIATTSVVFAKDIINFIDSLFNNSTEAIDTAVENGYVQNIDMDFVYDNNIGVKANNLIIDSTNLDISFLFNNTSNEDITSIELYEYSILNEKNYLLYRYEENLIDKNSFSNISHLRKTNDPIKLNFNLFNESLLFTSKNLFDCKQLSIEVNSLRIKKDNNYYILDGVWNFSIPIESYLTNSKVEEYKISFDNNFIENAYSILTETSLKIYINSDIFDNSIINDTNKIILKDKFNKTYNYKIADLNSQLLYLEFDIGKYTENTDILYLTLFFNKDEKTELRLTK